MIVKNSVEVTVGKATRNVTVNTLGPHYSTGYVGKAYFCWKSDQFDTPYVKLNGKAADLHTRRLVKMFLLEYKNMLMASKKSPLHFNESTAVSVGSSTPSGNRSISGVPHWMREEHKMYNECFRKDGTSYMRRTRFKPESKEIVEKYLPFCSGCIFRVNCEKACEDPDLMSQTEVFKEEDVKEITELISNTAE